MMFKKLSRHLTLALLFLVLTLGQQYLFYYVKGLPIVWLSSGKYLGIFAFLLAATFIRPNYLRFFFLGFIFLMNMFQMGHLAYFGTQILPNELYLFLVEFSEIKGTLFVEYGLILMPVLFTFVPALIGWLAIKRAKGLYGSKILGVLFCLYFVYNPVRTFVTGNTWGRQPSTRELSGMNVYLSFSYFLGKILPHKIARGQNVDSKNASTELYLSEGKSEWDKIIVVLGESLTPHHMSLYGYERTTTPFLLSQSKNPNFFSTTALSGGVSTDIAVAFLLNMGFGEPGSAKAAKGNHCLFKLAKEKKYTTHFLSIQSAEQLRYIAPYLCASYLDDYQTLEDIAPNTPDHLAAKDTDLMGLLQKLINFETNQFIMLHQRGSHGPWEMRSTEANRIFTHDSKINHYDNSVIEFDLFMKELYQMALASKKKILVVYLSDHGEALGQDGKWGHGQLIPAAFEIPFIVQSFNQDLPPATKLIPKFIPHYNISLYLAHIIGFTPSQDFLQPVKNYVIFGNDIDGFAGKANVSFKADGTYDFKVSN
jgi:glucan phosphoethanolaminetransferase (alkaline phosphatase superfamily)